MWCLCCLLNRYLKFFFVLTFHMTSSNTYKPYEQKLFGVFNLLVVEMPFSPGSFRISGLETFLKGIRNSMRRSWSWLEIRRRFWDPGLTTWPEVPREGAYIGWCLSRWGQKWEDMQWWPQSCSQPLPPSQDLVWQVLLIYALPTRS